MLFTETTGVAGCLYSLVKKNIPMLFCN